MEEIMKTMNIEHDCPPIPNRPMASRIGYAVMGFVYAVATYQVSASIVAFVIDSTRVADLTSFSIVIQFIVGISLSAIAYSRVSNHSLKIGMRVCYGLAVGYLFVIGAYTILASLMNL
jgi:hypothetical protein